MPIPRAQTLKKIALAAMVAFLAVVLGSLGNVIGNDLTIRLTENGINARTIYIVIAILTFFVVLLTAWSVWADDSDADKAAPKPPPEAELKDLLTEFHSTLLKHYQKRYEGKLDGRFEITLDVNNDWRGEMDESFAVNYKNNKNLAEAFEAINSGFRENGRLLVVGNPGAGKTVLLLRLALDLLKDAKPEHGDPLPVIFNLASWSENIGSFKDWLVDVLRSGNGLSKDFAEELLSKHRIIFFLDGLDELARNEEEEIAAEIRAKCLDSLFDYLPGECRAVIGCRTNEFATIYEKFEADTRVFSKVEVKDLSEAAVLNALLQARETERDKVAAKFLEDAVNRIPRLAKIIQTPFFFTTALAAINREVKDSDLPPDDDGLKTLLMERFVQRKIQGAKNPGHFEKNRTLKWLGWLARLMEKKQIVIFELADLQPGDLTKKWIYRFAVGLYLGMVLGLVVGLFFGLVFSSLGLVSGLFFSLGTSLVFGLSCSLFIGLIGLFVRLDDKDIRTEDIVMIEFSPNAMGRALFFGLVGGLFFSLVGGLLIGLVGGLFLGLFFGWVLGLFVGLSYGLEELKTVQNISNLDRPYQRLMGGFSTNLFLGITVFITMASMNVVLEHWVRSFVTGYIGENALVLFGALRSLTAMSVVIVFHTAIARHSCLRFLLWIEDAMPRKYATFLDHCAEAGILEKDGGHWRFRHQYLQDHFTKVASKEGSQDSEVRSGN
jgi:energy-coupling factor transporter ATP-binding protein EcfA2